jgi:N-acetylglutamate synthase-like GNAT family acetyltransferase
VVAIRKATQEDRGAIYNVHRCAALQIDAGHYGTAELEAWVTHLSPDRYEQPIATQEFVVAELDGTVVGFGQLELETGVVKAVYVLPDRGGKGFGASLLNALERSARVAGIERLRLDASLNSVGFYERMGYQAERPGVHRTTGGQEIQCVHMRKELAP